MAILGLLYLVVPVLAIIVLVRIARLEREFREGQARDAARQNWLKERIEALEQRVAGAPGPPVAPGHPPAVEPSAQPPIEATGPTPPRPSAPPPAPASAAPPRRFGGLDLETLIAGRLLNRIGILAILFAAGFFLKYAFDNDWIGDRGKVAIGFLSGSALLVASRFLLRGGYLYFSEGIAGLGAGILYLSIYAGWSVYHLFPPAAAFGGMIAVTAALVAIAVGRDSQRVAWIALAGGFLTPALVSTGRDQAVILFGYLAVLDAALLVLARARGWRTLEVPAFLFTQAYFWEWYPAFYKPERLAPTLAFATLFFVLFAARPVLRARKEATLHWIGTAVVLANALAFLWVLRAMLWPDHRWPLTTAVLALGVAHLLVARAIGPREGAATRVRLVFAGLALTFATIAIPVRLEGMWITLAWAVEGAVLVWTGLRVRMRFARVAGLVLFGMAVFRLLAVTLEARTLLLNPRFATFIGTVLCYALAVRFVRAQRDRLAPHELNLFGPVGIAANVLALGALSMEVWDHLGRAVAGTPRDIALAQQLGLSILWILYASGLLILGTRRQEAALRWQALILFGLVVGKVFLFDLSFLQRFYRIVSFVVLGAVLLAVSFIYQRRLSSGGPKDSS